VTLGVLNAAHQLPRPVWSTGELRGHDPQKYGLVGYKYNASVHSLKLVQKIWTTVVDIVVLDYTNIRELL